MWDSKAFPCIFHLSPITKQYDKNRSSTNLTKDPVVSNTLCKTKRSYYSGPVCQSCHTEQLIEVWQYFTLSRSHLASFILTFTTICMCVRERVGSETWDMVSPVHEATGKGVSPQETDPSCPFREPLLQEMYNKLPHCTWGDLPSVFMRMGCNSFSCFPCKVVLVPEFLG